MKHIIFQESDSYKVAVLIKTSSFNKMDLERNYVEPLTDLGVNPYEIIGFNLKQPKTGKPSVSYIKEYLKELLSVLQELSVTHLYVADAAYFKVLTKSNKAEPHLGYVLPCSIAGYESMKVVLGVNHQALIYNPELQAKLTLSLKTLSDSLGGTYEAIGTGIVHSGYYPRSLDDISVCLAHLHQHPALTCDIEAFSLGFDKAGIGTIAFAWDKHNGVAFACDYAAVTTFAEASASSQRFGDFRVNPAVRYMLRKFFETYQGELTFHNCTYDIKVAIYSLWMESPLDSIGCLTGLEILTRNFQDTKIIAYLATNTTAGNVLGLKALAHEFAGNWAQDDIKDIRKIPLKELLQYNLVDCLSTWFVKDKYWPIMCQDGQLEIYRNLMLPSLKVIIQMELTGMPMDAWRVGEVKKELWLLQETYEAVLNTSPTIKMLNLILQNKAMEDANAKLKVKQHPLDKFKDVVFNPNSNQQVQRLLYDQMGLPVLDLTETKQPATGGDTIAKLINHTVEPAYKAILSALIGHGQVTKILSSFIPAFEDALIKSDGRSYLHGGFNLGGTVSGRLSSSKPNLQNIPANSAYGKLIKSCFSAPEGWLFCGADFNSLEDYVSALTTKDPNKLKVYEDGFDGHCLRAAYYFKDKCPEIDPTDPVSVNSMKKKYADLRQDSKGPTFALTYQGTWHTLVNNLGFDEDKAKSIEAGYHDLYKVSDAYVQGRLQQASKDGYVDVAFGLRVRTPLLSQVVYGSSTVPYEAAAEGRTAGNALGQSYGLLNNRAANEFMQKVWASKYRYDIKPVALIHDAIYLLVRNDEAVVEWVNNELIKSMQWQELPELRHDTVKLGAALDIYWPNWATATTLPNQADRATIQKVCQDTKNGLLVGQPN